VTAEELEAEFVRLAQTRELDKIQLYLLRAVTRSPVRSS
jgi:hypothetical protein